MVAPKTVSNLNQLGMDFLHIELSLAHTFLDSAEISHQTERKDRSRQDAETAYKTVLKHMVQVRFTDSERFDFAEELEKLRVRLVDAGMLA